MVRSGATFAKYRCGGRFLGRRVNCEHVPLLPAGTVARMLDDPREIPYLLVWRSTGSGAVQEAARIARHSETPCLGGLDWTDAVEIKRPDGTRNFIRTALRLLPQNGGRVRLLVCPYCNVPRRALYGWEPGGRFTSSTIRSTWGCRACNKLRYASEGGALVFRSRWALARLIEEQFGGRSPRPDLWLPRVFTSPDEAVGAGVGAWKT